MQIDEIKNLYPTLAFSHSLNLENISKINCSGAVDVEFIQSNSKNGFALMLTDNQDIIKNTEFVVSDDLLHIRSKGTVSINGIQISSSNMQINNFAGGQITINGQQIVHTGSGDQYNCIGGSQHIIKSCRSSNDIQVTKGAFKIFVVLPKLDCLKLSGAGSFNSNNINQDFLEIGLSGSGDICLTGVVQNIVAKLSGTGLLNLKKLDCKIANLKLSGVGKIKANVTEAVTAKVSGVGDIKIYGNPEVRNISKSGLGSIKFK